MHAQARPSGLGIPVMTMVAFLGFFLWMMMR